MSRGDYYFDGGLFQLIGWRILGFLITGITLGICFPWAITMIYSWEVALTYNNYSWNLWILGWNRTKKMEDFTFGICKLDFGSIIFLIFYKYLLFGYFLKFQRVLFFWH